METIFWSEQYRPKDVESFVLPKDLKDTFSEFVQQGNIPNLILSGQPGVGKTTAAKVLVDEIGATYIMIGKKYGSEKSGIDVLRTKIKNFASTVSLEGGRKYLIIDEADYLNAQSTQPALSGFMEEFHRNCGFIFTCTNHNLLIEPLHSRCSVIEFSIPNTEKQTLASEFFKRVIEILDEESIIYNKKVVAELINNRFPDCREVLDRLQRHSVIYGTIDAHH
jgi:DNA polymerase III delta prime subunit